MQVLRGSAADLSVVTRSVRPQLRCASQVGVMQRSIRVEPGVGQQSDAAGKIPLDDHLLNIQQSDLLPA